MPTSSKANAANAHNTNTSEVIYHEPQPISNTMAMESVPVQIPSGPVDNQPSINLREPQKPKDFRYNNLSQIEYTKYGFKVPEHIDAQERRFLSMVDISKGPLKRTVIKALRRMATDPQDGRRKEYLYYVEKWEGFDMFGNEVPPVTGHVEGKYTQIKVRYPIIDGVRQAQPVEDGAQTVYYIEWKPEYLDELISKSWGQSKDTINYTVHVNDTSRCDVYSYDQFKNLSFLELQKLFHSTGGPLMHPYTEEPKENS